MLKKVLAFLVMMYAAVAFAAVDANTASAADLDSVKGIGPAMSARIIDARKTGKFKDWDDMITRVKGIGEKNAAKFSEGGLTVNGANFKGAAPKADSKAKTEDKAKKDADKSGKDASKAPTKADATPKKDAEKSAKADDKAKKDADKKPKAESKTDEKAKK